jgi:hypothetical protein
VRPNDSVATKALFSVGVVIVGGPVALALWALMTLLALAAGTLLGRLF